ncbi:MAG: hypothetical protein MUF47_12615 [Porphyrobacter sp.]|nr:hypothetical protein [Porphyrobacter sp.]
MRFGALIALIGTLGLSPPAMAHAPRAVAGETTAPRPVKAPSRERADAATWSRISASFSLFPLGLPTLPAAIGRLRNGTECWTGIGILCEIEGDNGILHFTDSRNVLRAKEVEVDPHDTSPTALGALGIGTARGRDQVMDRVNTFAPELSFSCQDHAEYAEGEGSTLCEAQVAGHGTVSLVFDGSGTLWFVRQSMLGQSDEPIVVS